MPSHTNAVRSSAEAHVNRTYSADVKADVSRAVYEAMSPEEIDAELKAAGINPQPTIDAVTALVREKLSKRHPRRAAS